MRNQIISYAAIVLSLISILWQWKTQIELKQFYCEMQRSIYVERRFIQTSISDLADNVGIDINFDKKIYYPNGTEVINPITTNADYGCS